MAMTPPGRQRRSFYVPHEQRECLTGIFTYHGQHFIRPVITQLVVPEIDGTHMVRPSGAHT